MGAATSTIPTGLLGEGLLAATLIEHWLEPWSSRSACSGRGAAGGRGGRRRRSGFDDGDMARAMAASMGQAPPTFQGDGHRLGSGGPPTRSKKKRR